MNPLLIAAIAAVVVIVLIAALFKLLWKVPAADQALIVTGMGASGTSAAGRTFKIITGGGAMVIPALQRAQYLSLQADKAMLEVEGVDSQKIPLGFAASRCSRSATTRSRSPTRPRASCTTRTSRAAASARRCTTWSRRSSTATCARSSAG